MARVREWKGKWQVRWYAPDGSRRNKSFDRKSDANRFANRVEADKDRGLYNSPHLGKIPFDEWAAHWLSSKVRIKPKTKAGYESLLRTHLLPEFGKTQLARIDPIQVQEWVAGLDGTGLSTSRMRQAYQLLSAMLNSAVESGYLGRTPCVGVRLPQTQKREKYFLNEEQVAMLAAKIVEPYDTLVLVLAYGGLRWGEATGLRRGKCDLLRSRLQVDETLSEVGGDLFFLPPKTYENRSVALPSFVKDRLARHLAESADKSPTALVFTSPKGHPLRSTNFRKRAWNPAVASLGGNVPLSLTPHHLRHTCASLLIRAGAHPKAVQGHLGHSSITVTMDVYGHLFPDEMDALAGRLDAAHREAIAAQQPQRGTNVRDIRT